MSEEKISALQTKIRGVRAALRREEMDKGGLTLLDVHKVLADNLGWRAMFNVGRNDTFRVALRREDWARRRVSRRWFYEGSGSTMEADYRRAGPPVPTPAQLAHRAETERRIAEIKARHDTD